MIKPLTLAALSLLLLAAPTTLAHGAAEPREIDTRVLADNDGLVPFGGCTQGQCVPGLASDGFDLVVLEAREASLMTGEPAVVFRTVFQMNDVHDGRTVTISFKAAGADHSYSFSTDGTAAAAGDFDALAGPFDAFDGFPKAVDGFLKFSTLGIQTGDALTDIQVVSSYEGDVADAMPGTWYAAGQPVPFVPNPEGELEQPPMGTYTLAGPAALLNLTAETSAADLTNGPATLNFTVRNPLTSMIQFVNLSLALPSNVLASLDAATLNLEPGASRNVQVVIHNATGSQTIQIVAVSDLGAYTAFPIAVQGLAATSETQSSSNSMHHGTTSTANDHHEEPSKATPGIGLATIGILALALAGFRRRI